MQQATVAVMQATNTTPPDAIHALVTITGAATNLAIYTAQVPDFSAAKLSAHLVTSVQGQYRVRVAHAGLWYFWAVDLANLNTIAAPPVAVWIGLSDNVDLNLVGLHLQDTLTKNQSALEQTLRSAWNPDVTLKGIVYGTAAAVVSFPAILISKPRVTMQYVASNYLREHRYTLEIFTFILHNDAYSHLDLSIRLASRCAEILNLPANDTFVLPSGTEVAFAQCTEGESDDSQIGENIWAAVGSVVWSGTALKQDNGVIAGP